MVKKKGKSKRTTLKDKYKIQKRTVDANRKRRKQGKRDAANGIVRHGHKSKKDPGIPNSWPFKQDLLKEIQKTRERQQKMQEDAKEKKKSDMRVLREHQKQGGTARTIQELMENAQQKQADFKEKVITNEKSDGTVAAGQQSRRAYLRELKKVVDTADVILQVLDARDPIGSRIHPSIEDAILSRSDKRMVLVLNKIDLVPKAIITEWLNTLRRSHPTIAIKASSHVAGEDSGSATSASTPVGMEGLLQLLKNYARTGGTGGKSKTTIVAGIIGYPNCGKSSLINALKRTRAVGVSSRPGFTTSMQEVVLDRNVRLLDSPGVVFDDESALLGNCVDADSIADPIPPVAALLERCNHDSLIMTYNIPAFPPGQVDMFLAMVARAYGRIRKGGIPDKVAAARAVLKDWNTGKIPYYTAPPPEMKKKNNNADAVIVSNFGAEFDASKFDAEVLGGLEESEEMDFVQLQQKGAIDEDCVAQDIAFLSAQGDDDESMDEDSDADSTDERIRTSRDRLANADDYDFHDI